MPAPSTKVPNSDPNKLPQAKDDFVHGLGALGDVAITEDTGAFALALLANDLGGNAKRLYSLNDYSAGTPTLSANDFQATTKFGAMVFVDPATGQVTYEHTDASRAYINSLPVGSATPAVDEFSYTIRMANGALSTASVSIDLFNANDAAVIAAGASDDNSVREESDLSAGGQLTIADEDAGQAFFVAHDATDPLAGAYGTLTIDADGNWAYTLDNGNPAVQALRDGESLTDTITVASLDGTEHAIDITVNGTTDIVSYGSFSLHGTQYHSMTIELDAGDVLSFDWYFDGADYMPYNDYAFWTSPDGTTVLSSIGEVGNYGDEGWKQETFTASSDGNYTFAWGVQNGIDNLYPSHFYINDVLVFT